MSKIYIKINDDVDFNIRLYDDAISKIFYQQLVDLRESQFSRHQAFVSEKNRFNLQYFRSLLDQARNQGIFDWQHFQISPDLAKRKSNQVQFNAMHKEVEVLAGIQKYGDLDADERRLVDEIHHCLHALEAPDPMIEPGWRPRVFLAMRYDANIDRKTLMPSDTKFKRYLAPGQVTLDFPYVGKEPLICLLHKDDSQLLQTCKVIDHVSYTWNLFLGPGMTRNIIPEQPHNIDAALTAWYEDHKADMEHLGYDLQKVLDRTGFCTVGEIDDKSCLKYLRNMPRVEVTEYRLID